MTQMRMLSTMRADDATHGTVRVEDVYDTDVDDLWQACTTPERLARWMADVTGDLRVGGEFEATFTSGWEGTGRVEICDPPHRLVVVNRQTDATEETVVEAVLTPEGDRTRLVVEERGLPLERLPEHGAGWQVHLEDLGAVVAGGERCDIGARWRELVPSYRDAEISDQR
jgi:uncharacterized protein YndB with AHSA1/START domain